MTRINSGIEVQKLTDEHLLAEHREIKRLPYILGKAIKSGSISKTPLPVKFTLGTGHIRFFLNKLGYIKSRYLELNEECRRRGFQVTWYGDNFNSSGSFGKYYGSYIPEERDIELIKERIQLRIQGNKKSSWHYFGKRITKEQAIKLLNT